METGERAKGHFNSGCNCAESVLLAVSQQLGYDSQEMKRCIPRLATGFGGGIARNGGLCGAVSGAVMAIGLVLGRDDSKQSREPCYPAADRMYGEFRQRFGNVDCRELTGLDMKNERDRKLYQDKIHHECCVPMVSWTAGRAVEIIAEHSPGSSCNA